MAPGTPGFLGARYGSMDLYHVDDPREHPPRRHQRPRPPRPRRPARPAQRQFARGRLVRGVDSHNEAYQRVSRPHGEREAVRHRRRSRSASATATARRCSASSALAARRLVEAGVPFVRVGRAWWDSHGQNFETHQEMVPELDHVMATLLDDLEERGLLRNTLVITLAEFGRTPSINRQPRPRPLRRRLEHARCPAAASRAARSTARPTRRATASPTARSAPPGCSRRSTAPSASTSTRTTTSARGRSR